MQKLLILALFSFLLFPNCQQEEVTPNLMVPATITGPNSMMCPMICCSGWFIEIEGESHHFLNFPEDSEFNSSDLEGYPVEVQLIYEDSDECWDNSIDIIEIEPI